METRLVITTPFDLKAIVTEAVSIAFKYAEDTPVLSQTEEKPLTRQQAADFLQVTPPTLDDWTKRGLLECRFIASEKRYLPSDLLAALKKPEISRVQIRKNKKRNAL